MFNWNYNYNPTNHKHFLSNANIITQYMDINDDNYYDYYHNTALLHAVQIHQNQAVNFEDYLKNNFVKISQEEAIKYIMNKEKNNE